MSRFIQQEAFGDPITLAVIDRPAPHAAAGQVRVRVHAAGLNPVDWKIAASQQLADLFGVTAPAGFGNDFAGVIDEVGDGVDGFAVGDRVFGGARGRALAEHVVVSVGSDVLEHAPEHLDLAVAATLPIAGTTAVAAIAKARVSAGDTLLVGGAAGGVGVLVVQLAHAAGARVVATASASNHGFVRELGATPTTYGDGLVDRVRSLTTDRVDSAIDLHGTATAEAALELGVPADRIVTIAAGPTPPAGVVATGGADAEPGALAHLAEALAAGSLTIPIQRRFPLERIADAVAVLRDGHVRGKLVVTI